MTCSDGEISFSLVHDSCVENARNYRENEYCLCKFVPAIIFYNFVGSEILGSD